MLDCLLLDCTLPPADGDGDALGAVVDPQDAGDPVEAGAEGPGERPRRRPKDD